MTARPTPPEHPSPTECLTSLDAQETSPPPFDAETVAQEHPLDLQSTHQLIAHRHHDGIRRRIIDALHKSALEPLRKRARRLGACCCCPTFRTSTECPVSVSLARCRDRLCPLCARRRGHQATTKTLAIVTTFDAPRLFTLTLKSSPADLDQCIRRLFRSFGLLRTYRGWQGRVAGGIWTLEVTRNATTEHWHAHLHIIADGEYFPQKMLSELWHEATGDSYIVDVRAIHDRRATARYVAQYVSKPFDVTAWPASAIREYATALHGKRLMQPFGTARAVDLDNDDDEATRPPSVHLCGANALLAAKVQKYEPAERAAEILARLSIDHAIAAAEQPQQHRGCTPPVEAWELEFAHETLRAIAAAWPKLPNEATPPTPPPAQPDPTLYPTPPP